MKSAEPLKVYSIVDRLTTPILERLNNQINSQRTTNYVESPTNAKQTLRAIQQIDNRLVERLEKDPDERDFDIVLDDLISVYEAGGGYTKDGQYKRLTEEEKMHIYKQIEILSEPPLLVDLHGNREILEKKRQHYLSLLPPHIREKYQEGLNE